MQYISIWPMTLNRHKSALFNLNDIRLLVCLCLSVHLSVPVCPPVRLSPSISAAPSRWSYVKFNTGDFHENVMKF